MKTLSELNAGEWVAHCRRMAGLQEQPGNGSSSVVCRGVAMTHPHAQIAVRAATLRYRRNVGRFASWRYAESRGCQLRLYTLACQLAALEFYGR